MIYNKRKILRNGFTLVEVLVAISILLIAVVGPMSLIGKSLAQIRIARENAVAVNLAQEGIEAIRQARDSNMLDQWAGGGGGPSKWRQGLNQPKYLVTLSSPDTLIESCGGGCPDIRKIVYQSTTEKSFRQFDGVAPAVGYVKTPFSRVITISGGGNIELQVTSTVTWTPPGSAPKTVTIIESLFGISAP